MCSSFRHAMVVSRTVKIFAWIAVATLNLFFVYFSLIRGLQRGYQWQQVFLMACVLQFLIEIFLYETSECAIVHYFIPNLVTAEVRSASFAMQQAVQRVCSSATDVSNIILDAPRYFFVSTNVAKRFPSLLESVIVQSYHSHSPGEIGKKWRFVNSYSRTNSRLRNFAVTAVLISFLKNLGATSPTMQRVLIHSIQPLFVSLLILIWMFSLSNPLFGAAMLALFVLSVFWTVRRFLAQRRAHAMEITPQTDLDLRKVSENPVSLSQVADIASDAVAESSSRLRASSYDSGGVGKKMDCVRQVSNTRPRLYSDASSAGGKPRVRLSSGDAGNRLRFESYDSDFSNLDAFLEDHFELSSDSTGLSDSN